MIIDYIVASDNLEYKDLIFLSWTELATAIKRLNLKHVLYSKNT